MADTAQTPEAVAFELLRVIAYAESKDIGQQNMNFKKPDRQWILDTYTECLKATVGEHLAADEDDLE
jgi:hypothetical protein